MKSGFTFVEIVVAAAIMALALSAFLAAFVVAGKGAAAANNRMEAVHMARQQMETLLCYSYYNAALTLGTHTLPTVTNDNCVYGCSYTVSTNAMQWNKDIAMMVRWRNPPRTNLCSITLYNSLSLGLHP